MWPGIDAGSMRLFLEKKDGLDSHDAGIGFDFNNIHVRMDSSKGPGLGSMRENRTFGRRSFVIESSSGKGTIIRVSWPKKVLLRG